MDKPVLVRDLCQKKIVHLIILHVRDFWEDSKMKYSIIQIGNMFL